MFGHRVAATGDAGYPGRWSSDDVHTVSTAANGWVHSATLQHEQYSSLRLPGPVPAVVVQLFAPVGGALHSCVALLEQVLEHTVDGNGTKLPAAWGLDNLRWQHVQVLHTPTLHIIVSCHSLNAQSFRLHRRCVARRQTSCSAPKGWLSTATS